MIGHFFLRVRSAVLWKRKATLIKGRWSLSIHFDLPSLVFSSNSLSSLYRVWPNRNCCHRSFVATNEKQSGVGPFLDAFPFFLPAWFPSPGSVVLWFSEKGWGLFYFLIPLYTSLSSPPLLSSPDLFSLGSASSAFSISDRSLKYGNGRELNKLCSSVPLGI